MSAQDLAARFLEWCSNVSGSFHNSPDRINLQFWLQHRSRLREWSGLEEQILAATRKEDSAMGRRKALTDDDIFGAPEISDEDIFGSSEDSKEMTTRKRDAKGRAAESALKKELKRSTQQGEMVAFILERNGARTVDDVENEFFLKRNVVMSTLNVVAKGSGIGYEVTEGKITISLPPGIDSPFEIAG